MGRSIVNLCFHGIGRPDRSLEPDEDRYWVGEAQFEEILDAVAARADVRLSFDDGNASDLELALPGLLRRGLRADFFVLTGRLGHRGSLDALGVRELSDAGMTVGTHGVAHRSWRYLDDRGLAEELDGSRRILSEVTGRTVTSAAYPFGDYGRRSLRALRAAGFERVYTSDRQRARPGSWLQPRFTVTDAADGASVIRLAAGRRDLRSRARAAVQLSKRWR